MTIQKKTAFLFTGIMVAILLLFSYLVYFFTNTFAFSDFYKHLEIRGIITAKAKIGNYEPSVVEAYDDIRQQHLEKLPGETEYFFSADSISAFMKTAEGNKLPRSFYKDMEAGLEANYKKGNFFYAGISYTGNKGKYMVIVGAENIEYALYAKNLRWILLISFFLGIVIAYTSGIFFSKLIFKPVRDIIDKVGTIGVENLHLRLEESSSGDEVSVLAATFNNMLSRLETAFETQNNFVSNASHEFRTPLTTIYGEADIALSRPRTEEGYKAALEVILEQSEKLQNLTDSLLNLAQTGFDGKKQNFRNIRVDELLQDVKRTLNNLIPGNDVTIDMSTLFTNGNDNITVMGNYELLKLGISNIIVNACKYSDNKAVSVTLAITDKKLQILTQDRGIGIPMQELKYIYDPFFRASNTGPYKGYGIGLPLTRNIFRLHAGDIVVSSENNDGTLVVLTLPLAK